MSGPSLGVDATAASTPASTRRLLVMMGPQRWWVLGTAVLSFATLGSGIGLIAMAAYLISQSAVLDSSASLALSITGVRFFAVGRAAFRYAERYVGHVATFRVLTRLRVWFFRGIEPLAPARLAVHRRGDLLSRVMGDIDTMQELSLRVVVPVIAAGLTTVLVAVLLGSYSIVLGVAVAAYLLLVGVVVPIVARRLGRDAAGSLAAARADLESEAVESLGGLAELVAWGQQDRIVSTVMARTQVLSALDSRLARLAGAADAVTAVVVGLGAMTLFALATPMVRSGDLDGVLLAMMPLVAIAAFESVQPLSNAMEVLARARSAGGRLDDLVDSQPEVADPVRPRPRPVPAARGGGLDLVLDRLSFSYDGEPESVLSGVSVDAPAGSWTAIVGPSGSGKSTLVSLLLRFWEYSGSIRIGGVELRDLSAADARRLFATVEQDDHLFDTTVRDNLLLADPDADDDRMRRALGAVELLETVESTGFGLDLRVGESGDALSGGERQRLMIARALLADSPVLVLDEATTHLDADTEAKVLDGIRRWQGDRTVVVISHRPSTVSGADQVLRLPPGGPRDPGWMRKDPSGGRVSGR